MFDKFKEYFSKYAALLTFIIIIGVIVTFVLMINRINSLNYQLQERDEEIERVENNYLTSLDTIKIFKDANGNLVSQISAYQLKIEELNTEYSNLFDLYIKEKNKEPIVIIEYRTKLEEKITNISTILTDTTIYFADSVKYSDGSYRSVEGTIPYNITYHIKKDMVNKFAFEKALYLAYVLEENGVENAKVMAFSDNKNITIKQALDKDTKDLVFKIKILESKKRESKKDLAKKYKIEEKLITEEYIDKQYIYYVGSIYPYNNLEPLIPQDSIDIFGNLTIGEVELVLKQGISLYTGLVKDKKTGRILIEVKSDYPGITFNNIVGADIMKDEISRKVSRQFRKEFGIGINIGYGGMLLPGNGGYVIKTGPVFSVGLNWSPKFLQFGASK